MIATMNKLYRFTLRSLGLTLGVAFGVMLVFAVSVTPTLAQESGDGPRPSGIVPEPVPGQDGRRLGNVPNDQIRQFQMRRACEQDLPECLPQIREMMEEERRNRNWMTAGIVGVLVLLVLVAMRESERKKKRLAKEMAQHRRLGERLKHKWGDEVKDPYKDSDPLGDD